MAGEAAFIIIEGPGHDGTPIPLREGITSLGRLPSNDVILLGDLVSRHHSRILFFDGKASMQDLGSHNGSWVNGERVTTCPVKNGDVLRVGNFRISFRQGDEAELRALEEASKRRPLQGSDEITIPPEVGGEDRALDTLAAMPPLDEEIQLPEHVRARDPSSSALVVELDRVAAGASTGDRTTLLLMYRATDAMSRASTIGEFLEEALELTLDQLDAAVGAFFRVVPGEPEPVLVCARGPGIEPGTRPPVSTAVLRWTLARNRTVFTPDVADDLRFNTEGSVMEMSHETRSLVCAPLSDGDNAIGALYVSRPALTQFTDAHVDTIEAMAHLCATGIARIDHRRTEIQEGLARESLARFHSPDVVERVLKESKTGIPDRGLAGRTGTVCFSDIQGFTALAERMRPGDVSEFLDVYLERMSGVIFAHRGTITKLLGDGIVAVFGAPYSYGNDAARAVSAALEMRAAFDKLAARRQDIGPRRLRFGINTGWILSGMIGSMDRLEYTVIGETVNIAARIQAAAAPGAIVVGPETESLVRDHFRTQDIGRQQIRGRKEPLPIFEVVGPKR